jgi:two-component system cell cycle sensor histidine kinase/response regulator CckA
MTRVLVVEDDAIIGSDIAETLVRLGYDVPAIAESSAEALREVGAKEPDVVLMDIRLRGPVDGVETVAQLRRTSDVPVVYLTAHTDEATLARAKETAAHGYLVKPFNERDLRTSIEVAIRKHELERHVAERERWFSTTLASLGDAVIAADAADHVTFMNPVAEAITGFSARFARGRPLAEVFRRVEQPAAPNLETADDASATLAPKGELVDRAGERHVIDDTVSPIVDERGALLGRVIVFRDVTERKRLERRLEVAERLASLGTMASGLAHELNNPLAAVMGNVAFVLEDLASLEQRARFDEQARARLEEWRNALADAASAAERLRKIVETMGWFVDRRSPQKRVVDVRELLEQAEKLIEAAVSRRIRIARTYGTTPRVAVDDAQFARVLANLLSSAADAVLESGAPNAEIGVVTSTDATGRAVIEIRYGGPSVRAAVLGPPFEPSYAKTAAASGTGLALAVSHSLVLAAGGELTTPLADGSERAFRVSLPPALSSVAPHRSVPAVASKRARVLVIDDELTISKVIVRLLPEHDVSFETDASAAVARIRSGESFDVILCDLMMPLLSGADVYAAVRAANPALAFRLVFLTGGAFTPQITEFLQRVDNKVVHKPFGAGELRAAIAALTQN